MKKEQFCPICKKKTESQVVDICQKAYNFIIDKIKQDHPEWVKEDGACPKCVEHYEKLP